MTPDEVRKMDNKKCLIFIRGFDPILDNKYNPFKHPVFAQTADGEGKPYVHEPAADGESAEPGFTILNKKSLAYYEGMKEKGEPVYIDTIQACNGCPCAKGSHTVLFLSGNFGGMDDGDTQAV